MPGWRFSAAGPAGGGGCGLPELVTDLDIVSWALLAVVTDLAEPRLSSICVPLVRRRCFYMT
jgi:hypothetical protein